MIKRSSLVLFIIASLAIQPFLLEETFFSNVFAESSGNILKVGEIETPEFQINGVGGEEYVKTTINQNSGFESAYGNGIPEDYSYWVTGYQFVDAEYQDLVHGGSYAGLCRAKGTEQGAATAEAYRTFNSYTSGYPILVQGITLDFWIYSHPNPDTYGVHYFSVRVYTGSTNRYMNYYIAANSVQPNTSSTTVYFDLRDTPSGSWQNIQRNLTYDYESFFGTPSPTTYAYYIYFRTQSPIYPTGYSEMVFDDVSATNSTGFEYLLNGDFESGTGSYWTGSNYGPGTIYQTDDHTEGSKAINMTSNPYYQNSYSRTYLGTEFGYGGSPPIAYYPNEPGKLIFEVDWKYSDGPGGGYDQLAYMYISGYNISHSFECYVMFGQGLDEVPDWNYTSSTYIGIVIKADGFGERDTWKHFTLDMYDMLAEIGFLSLTFNFAAFYTYGGPNADQKVELLIDDFRVISYPNGDPSFEEDWGWTGANPIISWEGDSNHLYTNLTADSHSGANAANLTSYLGPRTAAIGRPMYYQIPENLYTDFWWRLDAMPTGTIAYANYQFTFEGGYNLYYIIGSNENYNPSNTS
ncbi:MAG: hypothetical protein FK734_17790, partial [Asgard group archaeon]|nr:hypothetical protein [Asgard group archaeon]